MRGRNNVAYGLEAETTRALEASESPKKEFGPLTALNDSLGKKKEKPPWAHRRR